MFRNRNNSQKPPDELLANFKASYPGLSRSNSTPDGTAQAPVPESSLTDALDVAVSSRQQVDEGGELKDLDPTPRANAEQWRFTPSIMDPNSFAFSTFANQPPGYYTPTPGGTNTIYHPQAGDLHTPGFSMGLGTPLSMPNSEGSLHVGHPASSQGAPHGFTPQTLAPQVFHNPNPFGFDPHQQLHLEHQSQHQGFAPHHFTHQSGPFDGFQHHNHDRKMDEYGIDVEMREQSPLGQFGPAAMEAPSQPAQPLRPMEKYEANFPTAASAADLRHSLRYHLTLNAPTAMVKHVDEIPVTYLNKGQAYSLAIVDTKPTHSPGTHPRYRTFVRVSFEDNQQRQRPGQCWQLWKEGRGTNEAHHRGGRLQAVEFVDPNQTGGLDHGNRPRIELECASFDGFAVTWSPVPNGPAECAVAVRFNFLSTNFSHSKGVKGIPVRLCAKTQLLPTDAPLSPTLTTHEICYGKVKLFRDHGAERKLSNDVAHVKKTIDKLKQQIAQIESGMKDFGKRKRSESSSKGGVTSRPGKVPKHKRTWSMSSNSDAAGRTTQEDDLHVKLAALQDMFTSTRPASVLFLKGEELDDPDLHPVHLSGEPTDLTKVEVSDAAMWEKQSTNASSIVSPTPSNQSIHSDSRQGSAAGFQKATPFPPQSRMASGEWPGSTAKPAVEAPPSSSQPFASDTAVKIPRVAAGSGTLSGWIESLGVDYNYQPPPERVIKPGEQPKDNYFRAVYLMQRTIRDLVNGIANKSGIEPSRVLRTLRVTQQGLHVLMDNEAVVELPESQDMVAEFSEIKSPSPMKREWDSGATDIQVDGDLDVSHNIQTEGFELRLLY